MVSIENLFSLKDKTAIVTGGTRGIGRTVADYIAAAGANLAIVGTDGQTAQSAAEKIASDYDVKAIGIACDIRMEEQIEAMVETCVNKLGIADLLFNNAGIVLHKTALECTLDDWNNVMATNLTGSFLTARAFAKRLVSEKRTGSIVNNASIMGSVVGVPQRQSCYNASKAALIHLTRSLAVEWAEYGIRVNAVCPAYILSDMTHFVKDERRSVWLDRTPFGRLGSPEEIAGAVIYYFSEASSYTSGSGLPIDGCYTCV